MTTFNEFIKDNPQISLTGATRRPVFTPATLLDAIHSNIAAKPVKYVLTLTGPFGSLDFPYSMGVGLVETVGENPERSSLPYGAGRMFCTELESRARKLRPALPTLDDVLLSLAVDSSALVNSECFQDWADDYGYDTDSIKARDIYDTCIANARTLRHVIGREAFNVLMTCEEE